MRKNNLLLGGLVIVALIGVGLVVAVVLAASFLGGDSGASTRSVAGQILVRASGTGNEASRDFDVPDGCNRQELSYHGTPNDPPGGFVNFRVYDTYGIPADSAVGPIDLDEEQAGSALWTLDTNATYSIEVTADGAEWSFTLNCR